MPIHEGQDRQADLVQAARDLARQINEIDADAGAHLVKLTRRVAVTRQVVWILAVSFGLDVVLTIFMGLGLVSMNHNSGLIAQVTERLDVAQTEQRQSSCSFYKIFLDSRSDQARGRAANPEEYDQAFNKIQKGYEKLRCSEFIQQEG